MRNSNASNNTVLRNLRIAAIVVAVAGLETLLLPPLAAAPSLQDVVERWKQRESTSQSLMVEGDVSRLLLKGSLTYFQLSPSPRTIPHKDVVIRGHVRYAIDGIKSAYAERGGQWSAELNASVNIEMSCGFDGTCSRLFNPASDGQCATGEVWLSTLPHDLTTSHLNTMAISLVYRTLSFLKMQKNDIGNGKFVEARLFHASAGMRTLAFPREGNWVTFVVVDPDREFIPVRLVLSYRGKVMHDVSISFKPDRPYEIMSWKWKQFKDNGRLSEQGGVECTRFEINTPPPEAVFAPTFPKGTWVTEHSDGGGGVYVIRFDGSRRNLTAIEADFRRCAELMSGRAHSVSWRLLLVGAGVCALLFGAFRVATQRA